MDTQNQVLSQDTSVSVPENLQHEFNALKTLQETLNFLDEKNKINQKDSEKENLNPYQKLVRNYFPKDYTFKSLAETEINSTLTPKIVSTKLKESLNEITNRSFAQMALIEEANKVGNTNGSAFMYLSGTQFYEDTQAVKRYIEHIELVKNTTPEEIINNPMQVLGKFISTLYSCLDSMNKTEKPTTELLKTLALQDKKT